MVQAEMVLRGWKEKGDGRMKIVQSWKRNNPSSAGGYSITVTYTYSSFNPSEIDELEKKLPKGMLVMDTDHPTRIYPVKEVKME